MNLAPNGEEIDLLNWIVKKKELYRREGDGDAENTKIDEHAICLGITGGSWIGEMESLIGW